MSLASQGTAQPSPHPDPGSFRDPTNRVLLDGERILRGLDAIAAADHAALVSSGFLGRGIEAGTIVGTRTLPAVPPELAGQGWDVVLEHERIPVLSYPYEWTFSMLRDAALLELDLTAAALDEGFITKDATPYNVQFVGTHPVHIDVGSFEPLTPGSPWFGYRQFCEQFLFPLVLCARRGITHHAALRGSLRGVSPATCAASLRWRDRMRPSLFIHVALHAKADRRRVGDGRDVRSELKAAGLGPDVLKAQVRRLRRTVAGLEWRAASSTWSDYSDRQHYADEALQAKGAFVKRVAGTRRRRQVLDLGANDGYFTELVLADADHAVAVDQDSLVVEQLYRRLRQRDERRVLPLVVDLADPAGALGWRNRERSAFVERVRPDLVLCLALIHHLAITDSIPLEEVVDLLGDLRSEVVLEFPLPDDPMVQRLMAQKKDRDVPRYDVARLEAALDGRFEVVERSSLDTRLLYHLRPKGTSAVTR